MMVIFAQFYPMWVLVDFNTNIPIPNFTKICPVGVKLFCADWGKKGHKHNVANSYFRNFVNALQNGLGKSTGRLQMESKLLQNIKTWKENTKIQNQGVKHDLKAWTNTTRNVGPINKTVVWMTRIPVSINNKDIE